MIKQLPRRQRIRRGVILTTFILFPIIMNYFSPYVIIDGASQGIINGSFIVFGLMFLAALFLGRAWCGWVCPAGGLQEAATGINNGPFKTGKRDWIKWGIWLPWIGIIAAVAISAGGRADAVHHLPARRWRFSAVGRVDGPPRQLPYHLLDGAVHDPGPRPAQPGSVAFLAAGGFSFIVS